MIQLHKPRPFYYFVMTLGALVMLMSGGYRTRPPASQYQRTTTYAISPAQDSTLRQTIAADVKANSGLSGFHIVTKGNDALMMRLSMVRAAQHSLDIQYYSFQNDISGKLLLEALLRAADRGVRVRVLVDDITLKKSDESWSLLNSHKNIELRLFNPFATHDQSYISRIGNLFTRGKNFTKRMHNKSFIADNQLAIIGGRNLGDAYFDNNHDFNFRDVDLLAVGDITPQVSKLFDKFWNGSEAYPFTALYPDKTDAQDMKKFRAMLDEHWKEKAEKGDLAALPPIIELLKTKTLPLVWAKAELAADTPNKINQPQDVAESKPGDEMERLADKASHEFMIVSPYFIPGDEGVDWLDGLVKRGVKVSVLTNSLASTDVVAVHAGYRRYREEVISRGVNLFEMEPIPGKHPKAGRFSSASRVSLHTKLYIVDRKEVLLGTMNLDPRSIMLNTEVALVIHSPEIAEQLLAMFDKATAPEVSYRVTKNKGGLEWNADENGQKVQYTSEPKAGIRRTLLVNLYALLPFENQL